MSVIIFTDFGMVFKQGGKQNRVGKFMDTIARQLDRKTIQNDLFTSGMEANIVHIGFGAFHRHRAVYQRSHE